MLPLVPVFVKDDSRPFDMHEPAVLGFGFAAAPNLN